MNSAGRTEWASIEDDDGETILTLPSPRQTIDPDALRLATLARGRNAVWQGLRRAAEDWHPSLGDDAQELARHERRYESAVRAYFAEQQTLVERIIDQLVVDPASLEDVPFASERFVALTTDVIERILTLGATAAQHDLAGTAQREAGEFPTTSSAGVLDPPPAPAPLRFLTRLFRARDPAIYVDWDLDFPEARAFVRDHGLELAKGLDEVTIRRLRAIIERGIAEGWPIEKTRRRVLERFQDMKTWRARMIAQTETLSAYAQGSLQVYREAGVQQKKWLDGQTGACPLCTALNDQTIPIDELFDGAYDGPPRHPSCRCAIRAVWKE